MGSQTLTPIPEDAAIRAMSRGQLEEALKESHIVRCKLEQRVIELQGDAYVKETDPAQRAEDRRAEASAEVIEQRDAGSLARSVAEPRVGNLETRVKDLETQVVGEPAVATDAKDLSEEARYKHDQITPPKDVDKEVARGANADAPVEGPHAHPQGKSPSQKPSKR